MIDFHFESDFVLTDLVKYSDWISRVLDSEGFQHDNVDFIFCDDDYLLELNLQYLNHDTLTDIITFDYTRNDVISGDIFISHERVRENARMYNEEFKDELLRVMCHGVLHMMGYGDKTEEDSRIMRKKEDEKIKMFHVEQ